MVLQCAPKDNRSRRTEPLHQMHHTVWRNGHERDFTAAQSRSQEEERFILSLPSHSCRVVRVRIAWIRLHARGKTLRPLAEAGVPHREETVEALVSFYHEKIQTKRFPAFMSFIQLGLLSTMSNVHCICLSSNVPEHFILIHTTLTTDRINVHSICVYLLSASYCQAPAALTTRRGS
jgi:hypothetical protein